MIRCRPCKDEADTPLTYRSVRGQPVEMMLRAERRALRRIYASFHAKKQRDFRPPSVIGKQQRADGQKYR